MCVCFNKDEAKLTQNIDNILNIRKLPAHKNGGAPMTPPVSTHLVFIGVDENLLPDTKT